MKQLLLVGICGGAGAIVRLLVSSWSLRWLGDAFPVGTFAVNVVGCGLMGMLFQADETARAIPAEWRVALAAGFLGGLTTFSTFGLETVRLMELGRWSIAIANIGANLLLGLAGVQAGRALVHWWMAAR